MKFYCMNQKQLEKLNNSLEEKIKRWNTKNTKQQLSANATK